MPDTPASPESEQIADVAINDEETIVRRPALDAPGDATITSERSTSATLVGPAGLEPAT